MDSFSFWLGVLACYVGFALYFVFKKRKLKSFVIDARVMQPDSKLAKMFNKSRAKVK